MGTVNYMSPEQAARRRGRLPFRPVLLRIDPLRDAGRSAGVPKARSPPRPSPRSFGDPRSRLRTGKALDLPTPVAWIVERCLAKEPDDRFVSTRDLARDLASVRDHLSAAVSGASRAAVAKPRAGVGKWILPAIALFLALAVSVWMLRRSVDRDWPTLPTVDVQARDRHRGAVRSRRHDGRVFGAVGGNPSALFTVSDGDGILDTDVSDATLLSVSPSEELAVRLRSRLWVRRLHGTLARVPLTGGSPREIMENVVEADWSPDGEVSLPSPGFSTGIRWLVEYPSGKPFYKATNGAVLDLESFVALRKGARRLGGGSRGPRPRSAGSTHGKDPDARPAGSSRQQGRLSAAGDEIWYSTNDRDGSSSVRGGSPFRKDSGLLPPCRPCRSAGYFTQRNASSHRRASAERRHRSRPGPAAERDLGWLEGRAGRRLQSRRKHSSLTEFGGGGNGAFYFRRSTARRRFTREMGSATRSA